MTQSLKDQLAQLQDEITMLRATAMNVPNDPRPPAPSNLPRFRGTRDDDVRQWIFQGETLCRIYGHHDLTVNCADRAGGGFRMIPVLGVKKSSFRADLGISNYQAVLRQKLRQLRQTSTIEEYNSQYSALIFRVEDISEVQCSMFNVQEYIVCSYANNLDQVRNYCEGLKQRTHAYVKLQIPLLWAQQWTWQTSMSNRISPCTPDVNGQTEVNHTSHVSLEDPEAVHGRSRSSSVNHSGSQATTTQVTNPKMLKKVQCATTVRIQAILARLLFPQATAGKRAVTTVAEGTAVAGTIKEELTPTPLFTVDGAITNSGHQTNANFLLDYGATTVYVSRTYVMKHKLQTQFFPSRSMKVMLGDNLIAEFSLEVVPIQVHLPATPIYGCVAVVYAQMNSIASWGCPSSLPYNPIVFWKRGLHDAVTTSLAHERPQRKGARIETMFTIGVTDSDGTETKYITRKTFGKFLRPPAETDPEHDFMLVLTIKQIEEHNEPDNVASDKARRLLETDSDSFRDNPALPVLLEFKKSVFQPELPDGLPIEHDIEHRINVMNDQLAMYRQQWRLSPEQKIEIDKWVREMIGKGLIDPAQYQPAYSTNCTFIYLNSNRFRQSAPTTRKDDIFDSMAGAYHFSFGTENSKIRLNDSQLSSRAEVSNSTTRASRHHPRSSCLFNSMISWYRFNETSYPLRVTEIAPTDELITAIMAGYSEDIHTRDIQEALRQHSSDSKSKKPVIKQFKPFVEEKRLLWYQSTTDSKPRIVVPNVVSIKHRIIADVRDSNYGYHPGTGRTYLKLHDDWYWPRMMKTIKKDIADGEDCRRNKPRLTKAPGRLEPLRIPHEHCVTEHPRRALQGGRKSGVPFVEHQAAILRQCQEALDHAQARLADIYDHGRVEQKFNGGDRVYLSTQHLDTAHTGFPNSRNLGDQIAKWIDSYSVVRKVHEQAYELNIPPDASSTPSSIRAR
ncbi:TPA: hypothetical protein N0F65_004006 [Lagenidium giganteum]|uniref:Integrase zinc-binding domain-containing protein n=1 Tax=Lagenidium giganteum TaxID=4803 RepID=A0AAV2YXB6_9STRA|nr:TPA: hypothetical protein N0F65_004006 [Lagenidium giganteum]